MQLKAMETVEGLHGAKGKPKGGVRKRSNRIFTIFKQKCDVCQGSHAVRNCERYKAMSDDDRWRIAFAVWIPTKKERTVRELENVEWMAAREITTNICINQRKIKLVKNLSSMIPQILLLFLQESLQRFRMRRPL